MEDQTRDTYEKLAAGTSAEVPEDLARPLLYACFEEGGHEDVDRRLGALRVVSHLDVRDQMRVVEPLIRDADPRVRRYAFNLAAAARLEGMEALRVAISGPDPDLAVESMGLLVTQLDRASSLHARQWLKHDDARIRGGAAILLGNVSGPAMAVHLGRLAQNDPVPAVRALAAEAVERCTGHAPKVAPRNFWEHGGTDLSIETPLPAPSGPPPVAVLRPPIPPREPMNLSTLYPDDMEEPAPTRALTPVPEEVEDVREPEVVDWRSPIPLPSSMPTEATAILKLFARVAAEQRVHVLTAWMNLPENTRRAAIGGWKPGSDPLVGRGIALALKAGDVRTQASMLRHMLQDPDPGVRAGSLEAVGATGTLSMIPQVEPRLDDGDPDVRVAAVRALAQLLTRLERFAMLRERLGPLGSSDDARVKAAVAEALAGVPG